MPTSAGNPTTPALPSGAGSYPLPFSHHLGLTPTAWDEQAGQSYAKLLNAHHAMNKLHGCMGAEPAHGQANCVISRLGLSPHLLTEEV